MKAVVCTAYGPPEVLQLRDVPPPTPTAGEGRVKIHATAVTSSDGFTRALTLPLPMQLLARLVIGITAPRQIACAA